MTGFWEDPGYRPHPDEQIARLKTEVSIVRLVEAAGIGLKPHGGADLVGRCPFHDDRKPSLVVSPDKESLWGRVLFQAFLMLTVPDKRPERPVDYKEMDINRLCPRGVKKDELAAQWAMRLIR